MGLRSLLRLPLLAAALMTGVPGALAQDRPALWGLTIGVDKYQHIGELDGAVNDARDIAAALRRVGAVEVVELLDGDASREAILREWRRLARTAKPGDTLVVSYAGHGAQQAEAVPESEIDGMDEFIALAAFDTVGPGTAERILDDEIQALVAESAHLNLIFVADACHSGTLTRSIDRRAGERKTRLVQVGRIQGDRLVPIAPLNGSLEAQLPEHLIYLSGVQDHQLVEEVEIDGRPRGALSWAFARALEGSADTDGDGITTKSELEFFVGEVVRMRVEGRQSPTFAPAGFGTRQALVGGGSGASLKNAAATAAAPLRLALLGGSAAERQALLAGILGIANAPGPDAADLIVDLATGQVLNRLGDVVASLPPGGTVDAARLQPVVDKWRAVAQVQAMAMANGLRLRLEPGDRLYREGEVATLHVADRGLPFLTVFNLAPDGTLNAVYPLTWDGFDDPLKVPVDQPFSLPLKVGPPFGADHFVAVASERPLTELHAAMRAANGRQVAAAIQASLGAALATGAARVAIHGVYTAGR